MDAHRIKFTERRLREAEASVARRDWHMVKELADVVIGYEPDSERAQHYLSLFEVRMLTPDPARTAAAEKMLAKPLARYTDRPSSWLAVQWRRAGARLEPVFDRLGRVYHWVERQVDEGMRVESVVGMRTHMLKIGVDAYLSEGSIVFVSGPTGSLRVRKYNSGGGPRLANAVRWQRKDFAGLFRSFSRGINESATGPPELSKRLVERGGRGACGG